ncbi:hypothetical protein [Rapidithrix thailandica]
MHRKRLCIYPKDVQLITQKSEKTTRKLLHQMRDYFHKEPHQLVAVSEFCAYTGLKDEEVKKAIGL